MAMSFGMLGHSGGLWKIVMFGNVTLIAGTETMTATVVFGKPGLEISLDIDTIMLSCVLK